jgi:acyl-CoA thioester hydrolase
MGNHIYYARYLDLLEEARGEFFRALGTPLTAWQDRGYIFPVVECHLRYRKPARYDQVLSIHVEVSFAAGVRLNFAHRIVNEDGELVLEGETFHACAGLDERPKRLPPALLEVLERQETV